MTSDDLRASWVPLADAEARTGRSRRTLIRWIGSGRLPGEQRDGVWWVDAEALPTGAEAPADRAPRHGSADTPTPADGGVLVPLDAWTAMLAQLGNLHEAGQALAEARERAARAETEAEFLRQRLAEMRAAASAPPPPPPPAEAPTSAPPRVRRRWWSRP